jgi:hypothetical protein
VAIRGKHRREESPSLASLTTSKRRLVSAQHPLAPLGVVGFIFFRRQLLKISWAHLLAIFVENANVWRRLIYNRHSLDEGRLGPSPYENLTRQQTQLRFRAAPA